MNHPPPTEEPGLELLIGVNDDYFEEPDFPYILAQLLDLSQRHDIWKLDLEIRDEEGFIVYLTTVYETDAP